MIKCTLVAIAAAIVWAFVTCYLAYDGMWEVAAAVGSLGIIRTYQNIIALIELRKMNIELDALLAERDEREKK